MRKIAIFLVAILILLLIAVLYLFKTPTQQTLVSPSPTPTDSPNTALIFCKPQNLESKITFEGTAGNIYGTLSIKNTSEKTCEIMGNNFITASFDSQNIIVKNQGQTASEFFILAPGKTVYSQVHYPNGPQCSSGVLQAKISFSYRVSVADSVLFNDQNGNTKLNIGVCKSASEPTQIDVWSLSDKPVNQQP